VFIGVATVLLEIWMIAEAWVLFPRVKGVIESVNAKAAGGAGIADRAEPAQ
jgi:hypothetical protein